MKNAIKRAAKALALILCLCLTAGAAPAKADALDMVNLLSPWIEGDEAQLSVSYEIKNLLPYNDSTLTLLNNVLKHITVEGRVSGNDTSMGISVDGDSLFTLEETQENGRSVLRTELLPNRELTSAQNALDALFPERGPDRGGSLLPPADGRDPALRRGKESQLHDQKRGQGQMGAAGQADRRTGRGPQTPDRGGAVLRHGRSLPPANGKPDP